MRFSFALLTFLFAVVCWADAEEDIVAVVSAYEEALASYDSRRTAKYIHPLGMRDQFGSQDNYHSLMSRAFEAIKADGGIVSTSKGLVRISGAVAYVESVIKTEASQQSGVLELRKHDGRWLIYRLP